MKSNKKGLATGVLIGILMVMVLGITFSILVGTGVILTGVVDGEARECTVDTDCPSGQTCTGGICVLPETRGSKFSQFYAEFDWDAIDSAAQDAEGDLEVDVFEWDADENAELKKNGILDCTDKVAIKFDGSTTSKRLDETNKCVVNYYKFFKDSNYNAGDEEAKIDDYLFRHDVDSAGNDSIRVDALKTYLVLITESASTDVWDAEPIAFLLTSSDITTFNIEKVEDGTIKFRIEYDYHADAIEEGKTALNGECDDSEDADPRLGSSLDEVFHSSLTGQPTNFDTTCKIKLTITKDGYKIYLANPLADGDSERSYIKVYPYVVGYNTTGGAGIMTKITAPAVTGTGRVKYTGGENVSTEGNYTLWEELSVCGQVITNSQTDNADVAIGDRLYESDIPDCLTNAVDDGGEVVFTVKLVNIVAVNYSASTCDDTTASQTDCVDEIMGNGDKIMNFTLSHLAGTKNPIDAVLTG